MVRIVDICDMTKFEGIMQNWAMSTGLATVAVDADGNYISGCYNFTDFCIEYTRGSKEGCKRCVKNDQTGKGVYECHAGLMDFGIPITLEDGTVLGSIIGGQVLPVQPDDEKFRIYAVELGIDPDTYIEALHKVTIKTKEQIEASAQLLGDAINMYVRSCHALSENAKILDHLRSGIGNAATQIEAARKCIKDVDKFGKEQRILALNASIEAARAGDSGRGFSVVAKKVGDLANGFKQCSAEITSALSELAKTVEDMIEE